jgi:hypothetical protein
MLFPQRPRAGRAAALALLALALGACADDPGPLEVASAPNFPAFTVSTACKVRHPVFTRGVTTTDINHELNDYGRIFADADNANDIACVDTAAVVLTSKLKATLDANPARFDNFLAGALVALIFSSADRIGANGGMTPELDAQLKRVWAGFRHNDADDSCALQSTDNCMDGHSMTASGYGWIANYRYRRGDHPDSVQAARDSTTKYIGLTFDAACLFKGFGSTTLCEGTVAELQSGAANTLSLNIGQQYPAYGFGLMTSVAAAVLGYEGTDATYTFTEPQKVIARELFEEAQLTIDAMAAPDTFYRNCPRVDTVAGRWQQVDSVDCSGVGGNYRPQMYALNAFYGAKIQGIPGGAYQSDAYDSTHFDLSSSSNAFFSWGRHVTYGKLGYAWWVSPRAHMPRTDYHAPHGYLEQVDASRVARGWACDRDVPTGTVRVKVSAPGRTPIIQRAALGSETDVNNDCWGGSAHRFAIQLPSTWAGLAVTATVLDYRGLVRPETALPCLTNGCVAPAPPTVTVEWVQPSSVTWGPANTLTTAGYARNGTGGVQVQWRDASTGGLWTSAGTAGVDPNTRGWSATLPTSNYCHDYQVKATYSGVTSTTFTYRGLLSGHCNEAARIIWIQPSSTAGYGTPGALVIAGEATGAPAGTTVSFWYRNVTLGSAWVKGTYQANTDANGIWLNEIHNANYGHQYAVYAKYDVITTSTCTYTGSGNITWC